MLFTLPLVTVILSATESKEKPYQPKIYSSHPAADFSKGAPFLPRALLYHNYHFPLRDDGSVIAFTEKEKRRGHHIVSDEELAKVMLPGKDPDGVRKDIVHDINVMDTPFWRDAPLHHMSDVGTDLDGATAAWMSEPAFTKTEYIGEKRRQLYHGYAVKQIYEPYGFPFEVPCYTKHVEHFNSTTLFYRVPNRKFLSLPFSSMLDPVEKTELPTYLSYVISSMAKLNGSNPHAMAAWPQLVGRNTGPFTHTETRQFLNEPDGRLIIVDNEPRHLGVLVNLDYIVNMKHPLRYSEIKVLDEEEEKPTGKKEPLPVLDSKTNLKIDISWDEWSCCSACCCTSMLCGKFYTPDRRCNQLHSVKVRKGYLSLMKIDPEKTINSWDGRKVDEEFQMMMSISPYKERGIPLFSTMWDSSAYLKNAKEYKERLYNGRFKSLPNNTKDEVGRHPGIYIDEAPCTEEKYDCIKLAECRGIKIKSKVEEELEKEADPCADHENELEIIFIEQEHTDVPLHTGKNYRLRLREEVFSTDATRASWRVSSRPPAHFDTSKACLEQGIVLQKNGDLLLTKLTSRDVRRHVEVTLSDGRKISVQFSNAGLRLGLGEDSDVLIMWAVILSVFFVLLAVFVSVVHNRRRARMQQILQSRMRKRLRTEAKAQ